MGSTSHDTVCLCLCVVFCLDFFRLATAESLSDPLSHLRSTYTDVTVSIAAGTTCGVWRVLCDVRACVSHHSSCDGVCVTRLKRRCNNHSSDFALWQDHGRDFCLHCRHKPTTSQAQPVLCFPLIKRGSPVLLPLVEFYSPIRLPHFDTPGESKREQPVPFVQTATVIHTRHSRLHIISTTGRSRMNIRHPPCCVCRRSQSTISCYNLRCHQSRLRLRCGPGTVLTVWRGYK